MNIFFAIIGWYCIIVGILQAIVLAFAETDNTETAKSRRTLIWIAHPLMLFVGMWALKG